MKNKERAVSRRSMRRSRLSRRLLLQYALAIFLFAVAIVIFVLLAWTISSTITWQHDSFMYKLFSFFHDNLLLSGGIVMLIGWAVISYIYFSKPLYYLDEIVDASAKLANLSNEPIVLPDAIKNVQDELNEVRETALRSAAAAKEAEKRKNDLVVYLAHDLKTPLTSVLGYLTLLRDERQLSEELSEKYVGIALDKAERLESLINEFFDITRFNLTKLSLDEEMINITRMLEQIAHEFNPSMSEKSLSWDLRLEQGVQIPCDPDKLQRVFDNLFRNSVNYSRRESVITVRLLRSGENAVVQITNEGKTIPPEKLRQIFEQFYRLDDSRSSATGGAGLGLAIAKEIVELHGGTISAESEDGHITFTVVLPCGRKKIV